MVTEPDGGGDPGRCRACGRAGTPSDAATTLTFALYVPRMTRILTGLGIRQPLSVLRRMVTSVRSR